MNFFSKQQICWHGFSFKITSVLVIVIFLLSAQSIYAQKQLSLKEAISGAINSNRRVRIDSAAMGILTQRTALEKGNLLPKLELNTQASHYFQQPVAFNSAISTSGADQIGYIRPGGKDVSAIDLSMELSLINLQQKRKIESSQLAGQQYVFRSKVTKIDLRAEVEQAYLRIVLLQKKIILYHSSMDMGLEALQASRVLFYQGKAREEDTLRLYLYCKNQEPDLLKLQNALQVSKQLLNLLMGAELKKEIVLTDSIAYNTDVKTGDEEHIFKQAMAGKPGIKVLELEEEIAQKNAEVAKNSAMPTLKAIGQYAIQTQANGFHYGSGLYPSISFVGIKLNIPIISGNTVHLKNRIAVLEGDQARFRQQVAWKVLGADISETLGNLKENRARLTAQSIVSQTAQKNLDKVLIRYKHGSGSKIEVIDALNTALEAESNLIDTGYNFGLAMITLERLEATDVDIE